MVKKIDVLQSTAAHMTKKSSYKLPVLKEPFFYPTEASVVIDDTVLGGTKVIGTCMRAAYYRYKGGFKAEPYSTYTEYIFLTGKAIETAMVEALKEMGILIGNNIKFLSGEHHVSGELDAVIKDENGFPVLLEFKSYYGYDATKQIVGSPYKGIPGKPKDNNLLQVLVYLYLHKHIFPYAKLIYIDKTCQSNAEFTIELVHEGDKTYPVINGVVTRRFAVEDVFNRYQKLKEYVDKNELPPRDYELKFSDEKVEALNTAGEVSKTAYKEWSTGKREIGSWNCKYCNFAKICWNEEEVPSKQKEDLSHYTFDIVV